MLNWISNAKKEDREFKVKKEIGKDVLWSTYIMIHIYHVGKI